MMAMRHQGEKGPDSAAGFRDVQLHGSKLDYIPLAQHRNSDQFQRRSGELRGQQLKRKGDVLKDQSRDRDHQNQKRPWEQDGAKKHPSLKQNDQAR